ncbi:hypothetical protein NE562_11555 [Butyricicoccus faecihominis]|uniref:DUF6751 family protein n=1 Tax=Butyricicoccus faecihominis TaxID=1712515 RepID=UPI00247ABE7E|nr:DUF6751 family protein [Butyricicoccus faecihominis]MCQ5130299.1 hypothetical protein [Butyricicoccus faecihominis]
MFQPTITVWNRSDDETYTRVLIEGAYWEDNRGVQLRKTGVSPDNGIFVIIPMESAPEGFSVCAQDYMMQGDVPLQPKSAKELLAAGAVMVSAADRLGFGGLPHWEVTGK